MPVREPTSDHYRTYRVCGGDGSPADMSDDEHSARIAFVCPEHGVQSLVDTFEDLR